MLFNKTSQSAPPPDKLSIVYPFSNKKKAFTLAEIVIVMLIIAVIASISIKIIKTKLDTIISYNYYSAYKTVSAVTEEMIKDYRTDNSDYTSWLYKLFPAAFAKECMYETTIGNNKYCYNYYIIPGNCNNYFTKAQCEEYKLELGLQSCNFDYDYYAYILYQAKLAGQTVPLPGQSLLTQLWNTKSEELKAQGVAILYGSLTSTADMVNVCNIADPQSNIPEKCTAFNRGSNQIATGEHLLCRDSAYFTLEIIDDEPDDEPEQCTQAAPDTIPCGKEWSETECKLIDKSPWPPICSAGHEFNSRDDICRCVPIPPSVPKSGINYCKLFVKYVNTSPLLEEECKGTEINDDETDFSDKIPDIILRNGMRMYNVSQNPKFIEALKGNSKTNPESDETTVDLDEWGYKVYINIAGQRSVENKLWEDVYPFYVTLSGIVIPAYDFDNAGMAGGDSRLYLQTSVLDEYSDNTGEYSQWITKSKAFKESACAIGYVKSNTPYCSNNPAVTANTQCSQQGHNCSLKTIMPIKFF